MIGPHSERDCPDVEALAAWSEGRGRAIERAAIERHVAECGTCADVVAAALPPDERALAARVTTSGDRVIARTRAAVARWAVAATLIVATAALAYTAVGVVVDRARVEIARRATRAIGEPVTIARMRVGVAHDLGSLELRLGGVRIGDTDATTAETVALSVPFASLVAREPAISRLRLVGAVIHLGPESARAQGGLRIGGANTVAVALAAAPVEIDEGTLIIGAPATPPLRLDHVSGTTTPVDGRVQASLSASLAGATVSVEGTLPLDDTTPISITIAGHQVAMASVPYTPGHLTGTADLSIRVTGTARAPIIAGRVFVQGGRIVGWNPLPDLLHGSAAAGALAAVSPQLAGADLGFDELRAVFLSEPHGWRIPRIYVTSAGLTAGAILGVDVDRRIDGNGTLRMPPEITTALVATMPALAAIRAEDRTVTVPITIGGSADAPRISVAFDRAAPPPTPPPAP